MELRVSFVFMQQPRTKKGTFESQYKERRGQPISIRLPESLDAQLRDAVGWKSSEDNPKLKEWLEDVIAARLSEQKTALHGK